MTWLFGLGSPDWELKAFRSLLAASGADISNMPSSKTIIGIMFLVTTFFSPVINSAFGFGEELGWRGYLLPKLMPLGKIGAYLALGVCWGLWHAPLIVIGFNYPGYPVIGVLTMVLFTTTFGIFINEMTLKYESSILAGWIHGVLNSQGYGTWRILFPVVNPFLGGATGIVGILVWFALGFGLIQRKRSDSI